MHLLKSLTNDLPLFMDKTHKLIQKPVSVFGTSDSEDHFNPVGLVVTNGEIMDYEFVFNSIKDNTIDWKPKRLCCNETPNIRMAAAKVFGNY